MISLHFSNRISSSFIRLRLGAFCDGLGGCAGNRAHIATAALPRATVSRRVRHHARHQRMDRMFSLISAQIPRWRKSRSGRRCSNWAGERSPFSSSLNSRASADSTHVGTKTLAARTAGAGDFDLSRRNVRDVLRALPGMPLAVRQVCGRIMRSACRRPSSP